MKLLNDKQVNLVLCWVCSMASVRKRALNRGDCVNFKPLHFVCKELAGALQILLTFRHCGAAEKKIMVWVFYCLVLMRITFKEKTVAAKLREFWTVDYIQRERQRID